MNKNPIIATWLFASPEAIANAKKVTDDRGSLEVTGENACVYLRLTPGAAKALADRLLYCLRTGDKFVTIGEEKPEGTWDELPWDRECGFHVHPLGTALSIELTDMPPIEELVNESRSQRNKTLTPLANQDTVFKP